MAFEDGIFAALSPLCGGRVFPGVAPFGTARPYIIYQQVGGAATNYVETAMAANRNARIQVDCWADTPAQAKALARSAEVTLVTSTTLRGYVLGAFVSTHDEDTNLHGTTQDFSFAY